MTELVPGNSLGFLLADLARLYRQAFEKAVEKAGLTITPGEIRTLAFVARFPESRQAVLAERMGVEPMTLSAYLDRLEGQGLVRRAQSRTDRRSKVVETTDAADAIFNLARPIALDVHENATRHLSADQVSMLQEALVQIRANLSVDAAIVGEAPASLGRRANA